MLVTISQEYLDSDNVFSACSSGLLEPQWDLICLGGCDSNCDCGCFGGDCGCLACCNASC